MAANAVIRARVDEDLKNEAAVVLGEMGLTLSDLIRITVTKVAKEHAFPFEMNTPNAATRAALEEAREIRNARKQRFATGDDLIQDLEGNGIRKTG